MTRYLKGYLKNAFMCGRGFHRCDELEDKIVCKDCSMEFKYSEIGKI